MKSAQALVRPDLGPSGPLSVGTAKRLKTSAIKQPEMSIIEYETWRSYILMRSGLDFPESRKRYMKQRLSERMELLGVKRFSDYLALVSGDDEDGVGEDEWNLLLAILVNTETNFFRHTPSFEALSSYALPQLFDRCVREGRPTINIWSAGCSKGQEAYSLAMTYLSTIASYESFSENEAPQVSVIGTDIIDKSLKKARQGRYYAHELRLLPDTYKDAYMVKTTMGKEEFYQVTERVKNLVRFNKLDFSQKDGEWLYDLDVIFCHNVLMHLDIKLKNETIIRFCQSVRPGGFLFLTPSETVGVKPPGMRPITLKELVVYQREG